MSSDDVISWGLARRCVSDLRSETNNRSERLSQVLLGDAVCILEEQSDWYHVRMERDGYSGWVHANAILRADLQEVKAYQEECDVCVIAEMLPARLPESSTSQIEDQRDFVGKLPFGLRLHMVDRHNQQAILRHPDGTLWQVSTNGLLERERWPLPNEQGIEFTLSFIHRMIGVPYLWGGRTPFGYDCSGLTQTFLNFTGLKVPRDADQQFMAGIPLLDSPRPGDLLFFGEAGSQRYANVTHVAISLGGDEIIHANGAAWSISINSLDSSSHLYRSWLKEQLIGIRRFG